MVSSLCVKDSGGLLSAFLDLLLTSLGFSFFTTKQECGTAGRRKGRNCLEKFLGSFSYLWFLVVLGASEGSFHHSLIP